MAARKKKLTYPLPEAGHSRRYLQNVWPFYFTSSSPPPLCAIKETGIQTPIRWFFGVTSLASSWSASFPNKVVFLASTPRLRFIGLLCGKQSELGLGNTARFLEALLLRITPFKLILLSTLRHPSSMDTGLLPADS